MPVSRGVWGAGPSAARLVLTQTLSPTKDLRFVALIQGFPLQANRRSFDYGAQHQRASAQDDNSNW